MIRGRLNSTEECISEVKEGLSGIPGYNELDVPAAEGAG
jgi:hypothetical protein